MILSNETQAIANIGIRTHAGVNHMYGNHPYSKHLSDVETAIKRFIKDIPSEDWATVIRAGWLHDTIEDCRLTFNDVKKIAGTEVANIVYALTNEKGKTRAERANEAYYKGIRETPYAAFIKICDRIANVEFSKAEKSSMYDKYKKENPHFIESLFFKVRIKNYYELRAVHYLEDIFDNPINIHTYDKKGL